MKTIHGISSYWDLCKLPVPTVEKFRDRVLDLLSDPVITLPMGGPVYPAAMFGVSVDSVMQGDLKSYLLLEKKIKEKRKDYERAKEGK